MPNSAKTNKPTRGERNRNPLNIRKNPGVRWQGTDCPQTDAEFVVFEGDKWGYRAACTVLRQYSKRHSLNTVRGIIHRWAPPNENDSDGYAAFVAGKLGVSLDEEIEVLQWETMFQLLKIMTVAENGRCIHSDEVIVSGMVAAGMQMPASQQPAVLQPTNVAAVGGTIAAAAGVVVQTMDVLKGASDHALTLGGDALGPAFAIVALVAILSLAFTAFRRGRILGG